MCCLYIIASSYTAVDSFHVLGEKFDMPLQLKHTIYKKRQSLLGFYVKQSSWWEF